MKGLPTTPELLYLLGALGTGVVVAGQRGEICFANGAARRLLGCRRNQDLTVGDLEKHGIMVGDLVERHAARGMESLEFPATRLPGSLPLDLRILSLPPATIDGTCDRIALLLASDTGSSSGRDAGARELLREVIPALRGAELAIAAMVEELAPETGSRERAALVAARRAVLRAGVLAGRIACREVAEEGHETPRSEWWGWGDLAPELAAHGRVLVSPMCPRVRADRRIIAAAARDVTTALREGAGAGTASGAAADLIDIRLGSAPGEPMSVFGTPLQSAQMLVALRSDALHHAARTFDRKDERFDFAREVMELHAGSLEVEAATTGPEISLTISAEPRAVEALMAHLGLERMLDEACRRRFPVTLGLVATGSWVPCEGWEHDAVLEDEITALLDLAGKSLRRDDTAPFRAPGGLVGVILADADGSEAEAVWTRLRGRWFAARPVGPDGTPARELRIGAAQFPGSRTAAELFARAQAALLDAAGVLG